MYCEHCGARTEAKAKFCAHCGNRISEEFIKLGQRGSANPTSAKSMRSPSPIVVVGVAVIAVFCVLLIVLFKSVWINYPTEFEARKVFERQYREQINGGFVEIVSFKKTNGQSSEMNGVKLYTIEYEAEIKYPKGINSKCSRTEFTGWDCWFAAIGGGQIRQKGEVDKQRGKLMFERTEKGWKGPDEQLLVGSEYESLVAKKAGGSANNMSASPTPNISSGNLRSVENRIRAEVIFENRLKERVSVWWVNYQGQEILYRELDPQQVYSVSSFVTHPWRVRIKRNGQQVREIVANAPKVFVAVEN